MLKLLSPNLSKFNYHFEIPIVNVLLNQTRNKPLYKPIRGPPLRVPYDPFVPIPEPYKYNWQPIMPRDGKYTIMSLKIRKLGGRHPETGRVVVKTLGGGNKKYFRWIDYKRTPNPDGSVREEKVINVRYDPLRSGKLALVSGGDNVRWIPASDNILPGDIIRTHSELPRNPIKGKEGDAYPVGALQVGTLLHNIEVEPGVGGKFCIAAGTCAELIKRIAKKVIIKLPNNSEICVDQHCKAVVGRMSNPYHYTIDRKCAQKSRMLGIRPRSGLWHRKDGYCGRKVHPPKPLKDYTITSLTEKKSESEIFVIQPY